MFSNKLNTIASQWEEQQQAIGYMCELVDIWDSNCNIQSLIV
jgi:hypothetical protein